MAHHNAVCVVIVSAKGLRDSGLVGKAGSYCKCTIQNDIHSVKQTSLVEGELNPVWNFQYPLPRKALGATLEFEVWDWDRMATRVLLGKAMLFLSAEPCATDEACDIDLPLGGNTNATGSVQVRLQGVSQAVARTVDRKVEDEPQAVARKLEDAPQAVARTVDRKVEDAPQEAAEEVPPLCRRALLHQRLAQAAAMLRAAKEREDMFLQPVTQEIKHLEEERGFWEEERMHLKRQAEALRRRAEVSG